MNEFDEERMDELEIWRSLAQDMEARGADVDPNRVAVVSECLDVLGQIWSPNVGQAEDDSINRLHPEIAGDFLSHANHSANQSDDLAAPVTARRFGRFLIERQLGRGGHGFVFRAIDPVLRRPVAIKIPNPDALASAEFRRRFVEESRTLARLEHPNLLPILEAGDVGPICYLVTPVCEGPSLATWLSRQDGPVACTLAARLVRDLARTVGYVHSRGILHRDIKPGNVLLEPVEHAAERDEQPAFDFLPKLADFGLAKLVSGPPATGTMSGTVVGTPVYMAPEQAEGRTGEVGVATDVYALGAMLYELLTGRPPYRGESVVETLRLVSDGRLIPPSRLRADLPGDLSAICIKCLEFETCRRYRSADDLADDLTAFLECRPIQARSCGPLRRMAKWSRRRPLVASLAASLVVLAPVGVSVIGWQWRRADAHRQQAEETFSIAHGAIKRLHDVLFEENGYGAPEFYALQKTVLDAAMPYYHQLFEVKSSDPQLRVDFAGVLTRLGHMAHAHNSQAEALEWYYQALEVWQSLVEEYPNNREYWYFVGKIQGSIGGLLLRQKDPTAVDRLRRAVAIQEQIIRESPTFRGARWELSETLCRLVRLHLDRGELDQAIRLADRAIGVLVEIPLEQRKSQPLIQRILADAYLISADVERAAGQLDESMKRCREAVALTRRLVGQNQDMPSSASTLAHSLGMLAQLSEQSGNSEQSIQLYSEAIDVTNTLVSHYPNLTKYYDQRARLYTSLGAQYYRQSRFEEALQLYQETIRNLEQQDVNAFNVGRIQSGLADAYLGSARAHNGMRDTLGAVADCEKAIRFYRQFIQQTGETASAVSDLAYSLRFLAGIARRMQNNEQAAQLHREAVELQQRLVAECPDQPRYRRDLADHYTEFATQQREQRCCDRASQLYQQARQALEQLVKEFPTVTEFQLRLIRCNYLAAYNSELLGRLDEATAALNRGKELVLSLTPEARRELAEVRHRIAEAFQMAVHARVATGELDGGIENQWCRALQRAKAS